MELPPYEEVVSYVIQHRTLKPVRRRPQDQRNFYVWCYLCWYVKSVPTLNTAVFKILRYYPFKEELRGYALAIATNICNVKTENIEHD